MMSVRTPQQRRSKPDQREQPPSPNGLSSRDLVAEAEAGPVAEETCSKCCRDINRDRDNHIDRSIRFLRAVACVFAPLYCNRNGASLTCDQCGRQPLFLGFSLRRKEVMFNLKARGITGAAFALLLSASASADMVTFWKTIDCPKFGTKLAIARQIGTMEAPVNIDANFNVISVGGPYCNLVVTPDTLGVPQKFLVVTNASIVPIIGPVDSAWDCVVCQYPNKTIPFGVGMPGVSMSAVGFVGGGLAMLGLARLRRRQMKTTTG